MPSSFWSSLQTSSGGIPETINEESPTNAGDNVDAPVANESVASNGYTHNHAAGSNTTGADDYEAFLKSLHANTDDDGVMHGVQDEAQGPQEGDQTHVDDQDKLVDVGSSATNDALQPTATAIVPRFEGNDGSHVRANNGSSFQEDEEPVDYSDYYDDDDDHVDANYQDGYDEAYGQDYDQNYDQQYHQQSNGGDEYGQYENITPPGSPRSKSDGRLDASQDDGYDQQYEQHYEQQYDQQYEQQYDEQYDEPSTPVRSMIRASSETSFTFLGDEQAIPDELRKLQEQTLRRRRLFNGRLHQLQCKVAAVNVIVGEEQMDLLLATRDTIGRSVARPLENTMEHFLLLRDSSKERSMAIRTISRRLTRLECDHVKFMNVTLFDTRRDELEAVQDRLENDILPAVKSEFTKSLKVEGSIVRRHLDMVGSTTRRFNEEAASRRSTVELVRQQVQSVKDRDQQRLKDALERIKDLRQQLARERAERQRSDELLIQQIEAKMSRMKRALLAVTSEQ